MTSRPMVQDFTTQRNQIQLQTRASDAFEFLLTLFVHGGECDITEYAMGETLSMAIEQHASSELREALDDLADRGWGEAWLGLVGMLHADLRVDTIPGLIEAIGEADPVTIRRQMLQTCGHNPADGLPNDLVERAISGDDAAVTEVLEFRRVAGTDTNHPDPVLLSVLRGDPENTRDQLMSIVTRFYAEVWPHLAPSPMSALNRDAADKLAMAQSMSLELLVETATNGVTFDRQAWMTDVVLIPTAVARPWVLITDHNSIRIVCYPINENLLAADADTPPRYLVDVFKALGDEKRLRILAALATGETQLTDIAEHVDIAKSTAHHHLRVLRSAGLVRAVLSEGGSRYELRRESIPELGHLLEAYLPAGAPRLEGGAIR